MFVSGAWNYLEAMMIPRNSFSVVLQNNLFHYSLFISPKNCFVQIKNAQILALVKLLVYLRQGTAGHKLRNVYILNCFSVVTLYLFYLSEIVIDLFIDQVITDLFIAVIHAIHFRDEKYIPYSTTRPKVQGWQPGSKN